jgi:hypothetical protein
LLAVLDKPRTTSTGDDFPVQNGEPVGIHRVRAFSVVEQGASTSAQHVDAKLELHVAPTFTPALRRLGSSGPG